ncbi:putative deoxyribonuclease TATDN2 [Mytilus californianus]|uniref:putative deoxyribonuclease TATDN2 n=1 Tax=Mytilus californianus TaxID=6549 RepID=UPI002246D5CF|nr:putative deoxyribonuclease TATDN2 [Mytilus californianus]
MPPRTPLGDFLLLRLTPAPVDPIKLAGGVAVFCDPKTWPRVPLRLEPGWVGAVGIHPKSAGQFEDATQHRFHQLVTHPSVSALGEVGVDFTVEERLQARQISTLRWALQSCRFNQPVVLHIRGDRLDRVHARAHREVLKVMTGLAINPVQLIHLHCFQGGIDQVREWQSSFCNAYFGFGMGVHSFHTEQKDAVRMVPPHRILLESDAPYFPPPHARHGHPHYLFEVAKAVGEVRAESPREILRLARLNGGRLYGVTT